MYHDTHVYGTPDSMSSAEEPETPTAGQRPRKIALAKPSKHKIRDSNRMSVNRLIRELNVVIKTDTCLTKLKQMENSLQRKAQTLDKLNEEVLERTHEDDVEAEIEESDIFKEKIDLAIIQVQEAIEQLKLTDNLHSQQSTRHSPPLGMSECDTTAAYHDRTTGPSYHQPPLTAAGTIKHTWPSVATTLPDATNLPRSKVTSSESRFLPDPQVQPTTPTISQVKPRDDLHSQRSTRHSPPPWMSECDTTAVYRDWMTGSPYHQPLLDAAGTIKPTWPSVPPTLPDATSLFESKVQPTTATISHPLSTPSYKAVTHPSTLQPSYVSPSCFSTRSPLPVTESLPTMFSSERRSDSTYLTTMPVSVKSPKTNIQTDELTTPATSNATCPFKWTFQPGIFSMSSTVTPLRMTQTFNSITTTSAMNPVTTTTFVKPSKVTFHTPPETTVRPHYTDTRSSVVYPSRLTFETPSETRFQPESIISSPVNPSRLTFQQNNVVAPLPLVTPTGINPQHGVINPPSTVNPYTTVSLPVTVTPDSTMAPTATLPDNYITSFLPAPDNVVTTQSGMFLSPAAATTPMTVEQTSSLIPHTNLPKLTIKKFNGDLTKWSTFWDSFDSAIHSNPTLTPIDKFNYLKSYLEATAADSIAGLTLTAANYNEAVTTLRQRFGDPQLIIGKHMDALLHLHSVGSPHDLKGLRRLHDSVETHVRCLRTLGVSTSSYGSMLTSILLSKLPPDVRLTVSRELSSNSWNMENVMDMVRRELNARERSATAGMGATSTQGLHQLRNPRQKEPPTVFNLVVGGQDTTKCVYCQQNHSSSKCLVTKGVDARKEILRKTGRCYVCLKKHHLSRDCRSRNPCSKCQGRHHVSICPKTQTDSSPNPSADNPTPSNQNPGNGKQRTTNMYVGGETTVLLQTARMRLYNLDDSTFVPMTVRGILDSGSQRTYITSHVQEALSLPTIDTEALQISTFGSTEGHDLKCNVVRFGLLTDGDESLIINALVVPTICNPLTSQPISASGSSYQHLSGLQLADAADESDSLPVEMLVGSDLYWTLVTGEVRRGTRGPMAVHTRVGWVLSGPVETEEEGSNLALVAAHSLKVESYPIEQRLDDQLGRFWDLETLGIMKDEPSVYDKFNQEILFNGERYQVRLPWRESHPELPTNLELCQRRLASLLKRLRQNPPLLAEYDTVIREQIKRGMVEVVNKPSSADGDHIHYLPHHCVVRQDKSTSKIRVVYDASARSEGPSLNDCLHTGPSFGHSIFDILLRFRINQVGLAADIEKAFLMISMDKGDRDALRFLWVSDISEESVEMIVLRFARVAFGVSSSPFLLNATIAHHIESYRQIDPSFVDKFLNSIYVDDVCFGSDNVETTYELYMKARSRLAEAGFKLRKFTTNSRELQQLIENNEHYSSSQVQSAQVMNVNEEDQSYAKSTLGMSNNQQGDTPSIYKILGIQWDFDEDNLVFNVGTVLQYTTDCIPTKRNVVSLATRFYDPLGIVSPVTVLLKMFFQELCETKIGWDDPLDGPLLERWKRLLSSLSGPGTIVIPRCYFSEHPQSIKLIGFCDASRGAYAAVTYLRVEASQVSVRIVAAKTRVSPVKGMTIPRLELLSAVLLSKLISSVHNALKSDLAIDDDPECFTDSKVALHWIKGQTQEWKQFVNNRVTTIRALVPPRCWSHCAGSDNPADIPSRGMAASELANSPLWFHGPTWLLDTIPDKSEDLGEIPEECQQEMKQKTVQLTTQASINPLPHPVLLCENYSSFHRLVRVTTLVLKFIRCLRSRADDVSHEDQLDLVSKARQYWYRQSQIQLKHHQKFKHWQQQLGVFVDKRGLLRCRGRMDHADLPYSAREPILLDKDHHVTTLIATDAHRRVLHGGVKETLTELRSSYWIIRGRQFVRKLIHKCVICRKFEGRPYHAVPSPPLPEFRVKQARPFQYIGVDFAGPLYIKGGKATGNCKVWLCLYTCAVTRAVHLDLVINLNAQTFIRCFRRFTSRRGLPSRVVSDNGKTFKSSSKLISNVFKDPIVKEHFDQQRVEWTFNLEEAPWWGGMFERMIKSAKRCLKKTVGRARLNYDELLTVITEIEAVLNSRPLSYVSSEELEEPLTPSHLLTGFRVLSLPDPVVESTEDPEFLQSMSKSDANRRMEYLMKTLRDFWKRWRKEYLMELREFHRYYRVSHGIDSPVEKDEVVIVHDDQQPRSFWRMGRIESTLIGADGRVRGARVRVQSKTGRHTVLNRPIQRLYPLEIITRQVSSAPSDLSSGMDGLDQEQPPINTDTETNTHSRQPRRAAVTARDRILAYAITD